MVSYLLGESPFTCSLLDRRKPGVDDETVSVVSIVRVADGPDRSIGMLSKGHVYR